MALADTLKPVLWQIRSISGTLGLRPHIIELGTSTWSGTMTGDGVETIVWTPITEGNGQPPKLTFLTQEEITVGNLASGTIEIGPITPSFTGGGTLLATIAPALAKGQTRQLRITGPHHVNGAIYRITQFMGARSLHFTLQATPIADA